MKTLKTVNGETLMNTYIPPIEFVVDGLISQGLHILSGKPKILSVKADRQKART